MAIDRNLYIGTSGYNYSDWVGTFAPEGIERYQLLQHYIDSGLNFLEIAHTLYKFPMEEKFVSYLEASKKKLSYAVRLTKYLMRQDVERHSFDMFKEGIAPLVEAGVLKAVVADFHHAFSAKKDTMKVIENIKTNMADMPIFVELTHRTWFKEKTFQFLKDLEIGLISTDMPKGMPFPPYYPSAFSGDVYFRLYGRNKEWKSFDNKCLDYSYSDAMIKSVLDESITLTNEGRDIILSFCNVEKGNAPKDALRALGMAKVF